MRPDHLPSTLTSLSFDTTFSNGLSSSCLHSSLTFLSFGRYFNQPLKGTFHRLTHLFLNDDYPRPIIFPPNLIQLKFGKQNYSLQSLPSTITNLDVGNIFNECINNSFPILLTHLTFGRCFNQPVDCLPPTLTHLYFGFFFWSDNWFSSYLSHSPSF